MTVYTYKIDKSAISLIDQHYPEESIARTCFIKEVIELYKSLTSERRGKIVSYTIKKNNGIP